MLHRRIRFLGALVGSLLLALSSVGGVAAAAPANDTIAGARALTLGTPIEFDSSEATTSPADPDDCDGSHGAFPGPYFASVWFSYTARPSDHRLELSAPTMQGHPDDFLAITFVYAQRSSGLELVDCTAFGNEASWEAEAGVTYLIMEAGLSSDVTGEPAFSDRGGHGMIALERLPNDEAHYAWHDRFQYSDCGFEVTGVAWGGGTFRLKDGRRGDPTPYLSDNYEWHAVTTNPANGKWFREDGQGHYKDLRITHLEGTLYRFVAIESGRPFTLTSMDGERIYVDRGRLATTFVVDTGGNDDLSDDVFIDGSFEILADNGRHPGFYIEDWCGEVVIPLLGD